MRVWTWIGSPTELHLRPRHWTVPGTVTGRCRPASEQQAPDGDRFIFSESGYTDDRGPVLCPSGSASEHSRSRRGRGCRRCDAPWVRPDVRGTQEQCHQLSRPGCPQPKPYHPASSEKPLAPKLSSPTSRPILSLGHTLRPSCSYRSQLLTAELWHASTGRACDPRDPG